MLKEESMTNKRREECQHFGLWATVGLTASLAAGLVIVTPQLATAQPNTVIDTIVVGPQLGQLAVDPLSERLYVSNPQDDAVTAIDISNDANSIIASFGVGDFPNSVALNAAAERLYVVNELDSTVSVVDTSGNAFSVIDTIPGAGFFGGPSFSQIAFDPTQELLFVKAGSGGGVSAQEEILVIDTAADANSVVNTILPPSSCGAGDLFFAESLQRLYVICEGPEQLLVIDTLSQTILDVYQYPALCPISLGVSQARLRAYASGEFVLDEIVDLTNDAVTFVGDFSFADGAISDMAVYEGVSVLYASNFTSNLGGATDEVIAVDITTDSPAVVARIPVGLGAVSVALDVDALRGYAANANDGTISVIELPPVPQPDSDGDGIPDSLDVCEGTTVPEAIPTVRLGRNRFALVNSDTEFDTNVPPGGGPGSTFTLEDTAGCSCTQIIANLDLGKGHKNFGCSLGAMRTWTALVSP